MFNKLKDFLNSWINDELLKYGYISQTDAILRSLPPEKRKKVHGLTNKLQNLRTLSNVSEAYHITTDLCRLFKEAAPEIKSNNPRIKDAVRLIGGDVYGYRPGAAKLYGLFQNNPFGIYSFVARHHWAVRAALQVIRDELSNDGFQLRAMKGTSKKRLRDVYNQLNKMGLFKMRIDIACHIKLFGNAWILPHKNLLGGPGMLELLSPPRLMPIIDPITDQILGWEYSVGRTTVAYPTDKLYHIWQYTVDNYKQIGDPPLTPAILAIEADLSGDSYNNQIFQCGGLMGIILNMKTNQDDPIGRDEFDMVDELQDRIDSQYSGMKAAHKIMVTSGLDSVTNVNPGTLDKQFQVLHMETAKTVANCLGVPPEKIAVSRSDTLQYIPSLVEDSVNASFDKSLNALINLVDEFLNERVLQGLLGINDVRIVASGRYGALTKNAADTIKTLADAGPLITINQALDRVLGWEELSPDNPRGRMILDNTQLSGKSVPMPHKMDPEDPDLEFSKNILSKAFLAWVEEIKQGTFERRDCTWDEDSAPCDVVIIDRRGQPKYYQEQYAEVQKKSQEDRPFKEKGIDNDSIDERSK